MMGFTSISDLPISGSRSVLGVLGAILTASASISIDPNPRVYSSTREFITGFDQTPANTPFLGTLQKVIRFDRSILNSDRIGQVTVGWGEIEMINASGDYDDLIDKFTVDGRRVVVKLGVVGQPYSSFQTLFAGTATDWQVDEQVLRVQVRDNTYRLEVPVQPLIYAGTGGLEGTSDLKGKRRPRAFGSCMNVTPISLIPTELVYEVNSGRIFGVDAVYDNAVALGFASDFVTAAALRAATTGAQGSGAQIEAGKYATCLAAGLIRLGGNPQGTVTADIRGDTLGGVYVNTTSKIVRRLIESSTDLGVSGLQLSTFDRVEINQPAVIGYWYDGSSEATVADLIADLMGAVGGWGGMRRDGRFEVGIFTAPSGYYSSSYSRIEIKSIDRQKLPSGLSPPPFRFRVAWGRNYSVQTDVEGQSGVTPSRAAYLKEDKRLASSNELVGMRIKADHPLAQDPNPVESYFRDQADAQAESDRLLNLYGATSSLYKIVLKVHPFKHEIGEVVKISYPRWDLKQGRLLRIVSVTDDTDENEVEIIGFG